MVRRIQVPSYPNELRACIKDAGFSFREVAQETGIPESTLYDWAAGNRPIPHDERQALAHLLSCDEHNLKPQYSYHEGWSQEDGVQLVQILSKVVQAMPRISRQQLLRGLLGFGAAAFVSDLPDLSIEKHISEEDRVQLCQALSDSIAAGWQLFHTASNMQTLAVGQAQLTLTKQNHAALYPQIRYGFYSSTYNLIGRALHLQERYHEALEAHVNAHVAAMGTGNPLYVVQCLICQTDTYQALEQHPKAIEVIEEALRILSFSQDDEEHTRSKAHVLACWADSAMQMRDHVTAQNKLEEAAMFLDHIGRSEEFDKASWLQLAGKNALIAGDPATAIRYCEEALAELPTNWVVRITGLLVPLAIAYARIGERDESLKVARKAMPGVRIMDAPMSNKHFAEYIQKDLLATSSSDKCVQMFMQDVKHQLPHVAVLVR
ncbi:MAG: helix-turn-helix transcriptional regulator [Chloroflexota bacterium]|nr:helix-turn-helix transcriptional regulator [Chloroflexota bacterium]